jgi:hypothetical protein
MFPILLLFCMVTTPFHATRIDTLLSQELVLNCACVENVAAATSLWKKGNKLESIWHTLKESMQWRWRRILKKRGDVSFKRECPVLP